MERRNEWKMKSFQPVKLRHVRGVGYWSDIKIEQTVGHLQHLQTPNDSQTISFKKGDTYQTILYLKVHHFAEMTNLR